MSLLGLTFAVPWVLLALPALPLLWWLLRVTPPAARRERFPAIRLLFGLRPPEETPARTPWWLLLLRMVAAGLLILGLARPILDAGSTLPGAGPVLLVVDNGWASAPDWPARMEAANGVLDRAERQGRPAALLATAPGLRGEAPQITPAMPATELRARVAALRPLPWAPDRAAAAAALRGWTAQGASVAYVADGVAHDGAPGVFAEALSRIGPVAEIRAEGRPVQMLLPPRPEAERLIARAAQTPVGRDVTLGVLARTADGRTLARADIAIPAGETEGEAAFDLPAELRNQLARLDIDGPAAASGTVLLDERWRRRPVGLLSGSDEAADSPLIGELFYLDRALSPFTELRRGDLPQLLSREIAVIILADRPVAEGREREMLEHFVENGGLLVRFAGPRTAASPDPLMPVTIRAGDRQLGGALSWSQPAGLAPFPANSPFAGLTVPDEVKVERQVLAEPQPLLSERTWAALADGTPLVTAEARGRGRVVLFHVTANADWSNLPLSGLFVDMLGRLVQLAAGVAGAEGDQMLAPFETLDGFARLGTPPPSATGLRAGAFAETAVSPLHPPGLYGPENGRRALNLSAGLPPPQAAPPVPGASLQPLGAEAPERALGHWLIAAALLLLIADLLIALGLRGVLRPVAAAVVLMFALPAAADEEMPALVTRLAYVVTGDAQVDDISRMGLAGLSDYVNRRTAAVLGDPAPVAPGRDDLSFYPLIYWPLTATQEALAPAAAEAVNSFMRNGGIVLFDTRSAGSGEAFSPGSDAALRRVAAELTIPPLAPVPADHVLGRAFYLLSEFPGRYAGGQVWVARDQDRANDSISPVIIGGHDWAAAWAVDAQGRNPFATIPGGQRQRTLAYRFGVNLVMYALTGNYKGDQVHVPAILERLGN